MGTPAATANAATLLKLARECRERGDAAAEATALDRLLAADPRNIPALMRRADLYAAAGDARSASSFYLTAIRSAPASGLPRELAAELARAKQACDRYALEYRDFLLRNLAAKGFDPKRSSPRFARFGGPHPRPEAHLPAAAEVLLFPGPAAGPVLRAQPLPLVRRPRGRDGRHPRRARGRPARTGCLRTRTCRATRTGRRTNSRG